MADTIGRVGLVTHPRRDVHGALATLEAWTERTGVELVQLGADGAAAPVGPAGDPASCDLIVALGGDGTALAAMHLAGPVRRPVLGVACGSLGALTSTTADDLGSALDRIARGDFTVRALPGIEVHRAAAEPLVAVNDLVLVRRGAGQVIVHVEVDGERFVRFAGDGLVVATALGS
jgi:NAD+ kinase